MRFQKGYSIPLTFADDVVVYLEKDKRIYRKILELLSKFSSELSTLSVYKSIVFLYTNNTKEIKSIPFTIVSPKPQHLE